jgi:lipid II:glycine glycyltransferase (peptidoglycan interpeptide bridge formation enzyme)
MSLSQPSTVVSAPISSSVSDPARECSIPRSSSPAFQPLIDQVTESEWNGLLTQFSDASLYQTWAYGAVSWGEKALSHLLLKQDGQVVGMAQFRIIRIPLLASGIAYLRWGPLCCRRDSAPDPSVLPALLNAISNEYALRRKLLVRLLPNVFREDPAWPLYETAGARHDFLPGNSVAPYRTIRVDLAPAPELIRKRLDQKWRNQLNGAERNGLIVHEGTGDDLFAQFTAIYRELLARKQFETSVDIDEFARIQRALPESLKMRVLLCEKDGKVMAGLVGAGIGDTGVYLLGATSAEGMKAKGSYLLQWRMMQWLRQCGCRWYDLGGINPERNPGVYHFKSGFGGQEVSQCGCLEVSGSPLSLSCVRAAERLKATLAYLKAATRSKSS